MRNSAFPHLGDVFAFCSFACETYRETLSAGWSRALDPGQGQAHQGRSSPGLACLGGACRERDSYRPLCDRVRGPKWRKAWGLVAGRDGTGSLPQAVGLAARAGSLGRAGIPRPPKPSARPEIRGLWVNPRKFSKYESATITPCATYFQTGGFGWRASWWICGRWFSVR